MEAGRLLLRAALKGDNRLDSTIPLTTIQRGEVFIRFPKGGLPIEIFEQPTHDCVLKPIKGEDARREAVITFGKITKFFCGTPAPDDATLDDGVGSQVTLRAGEALRADRRSPAIFRVLSGHVRTVTNRREIFPRYLLVDGTLWCRAESEAELERIPLESKGFLEAFQEAIAELEDGIQDQFKGFQDQLSSKMAMNVRRVRDSERTGIGQALRLMSTILVGKREDLVSTIPGEPDEFTAIRLAADASGIELPDLSDMWRSVDTLDEAVHAVGNRVGFAVRQVELPDRWAHLDAGPLLTRRREDDVPIALVPVGGRHFRATEFQLGAQSALGRVDSALVDQLDSQGWMFYRPLPLRRIGLKDLARFALRGTGVDIALLFLVAFLTALVSLAIPIATGLLVGKVIPSGSSQGVFGVVFALVVAAIASSIFGVASGFLRIRAETRASMHVMAGAVLRTLMLPAKFFDRFTAGDLTQRLMSIEHLRQTISNAVITSLLHSITVVVYLGMIFYYSWKMALVAFAIVIFVVVYMAIFSVLQVKYVRTVQRTTGLLEGLTNQIIQGVRVIRANRAESRIYTRWVRTFAVQRLASFRDQTISNILQVLHVLVGLTAVGISLWLVGKGVAGIEGPGEYMAFSSAFGALMGSLFGFSVMLLPLVRLIPVYDRLRPIFQEMPEGVGGIPAGRLSGQVTCRGVSFAYEAGGRNIIDELDLQIQSGEYAAIVGDSGCGKSTLIRLLLGFEQPSVGEVSFDNRALHSLDITSVRMQIGTAIQDGNLLPGDIRTNILGASQLPIEEAWKVARLVGLESRIRAMPMGMFTFVTDQIVTPVFRQQMLLAKALVGSPSMLIVDEVTSQLDVTVQKEIQARIDGLGITRIVVAHRLGTIRNADTIHVLDRGKIVESGDYDTLAAQDGLFREKLERGQH